MLQSMRLLLVARAKFSVNSFHAQRPQKQVAVTFEEPIAARLRHRIATDSDGADREDTSSQVTEDSVVTGDSSPPPASANAVELPDSEAETACDDAKTPAVCLRSPAPPHVLPKRVVLLSAAGEEQNNPFFTGVPKWPVNPTNLSPNFVWDSSKPSVRWYSSKARMHCESQIRDDSQPDCGAHASATPLLSVMRCLSVAPYSCCTPIIPFAV